MRTTCPHCQVAGNVKEEALGKKVTCPRCKNSFVVQPDPPAKEAGAGPAPSAPPRVAPASPPEAEPPCSQCQTPTPESELLNFDGTLVCARCKPVYLQKMREGVAVVGQDFNYAGFWNRVGAKLIDGLILGLVGGVLNGAIQAALMTGGGEEMFVAVVSVVLMLLNFGIGIAYVTFLVGKYGATPGKMALGLKIIKPDGEQLSYLQAFGRYWAEMLSGMTLGIGYLMVAFDDESRGLHDRICETRVIRTR